MWLSPALLLLCLQGCLSLTGPGSVTGTVGGSLRVECQYDESYKHNKKYWCRGQYDTQCNTIVEAEGGKKGSSERVSITDHADNLTMTVIMEDLSESDAGPYWCKIQTLWIWDALSRDPAVQVQVDVFPGETTLAPTTLLMEYDYAWDKATTTLMETTFPATTSNSSPVAAGQNPSISTKDLLIFQLWPLLISIYFQILVSPKMSLFLIMLCVVFLVNSLS